MYGRSICPSSLPPWPFISMPQGRAVSRLDFRQLSAKQVTRCFHRRLYQMPPRKPRRGQANIRSLRKRRDHIR